MRLAWVTPVSLRSAIGRVGIETAEALGARGHDVEIWASEYEYDGDTPRHPTVLSLRPLSEVDLDQSGCDLAIVNFGDNFLFHAGGLEALGRLPVVGVFHDFFLHNLFSGWLWGTNQPPHAHQANVEATYGQAAGELSAAATAGELTLEEIAASIPMTEWVAGRCQGAIAHSTFYRPRLEEACPGPVATARLPWSGRAIPPLQIRDRERVVALTVGVMNPNKCCDAVIAAIGSSKTLQQRLDYVLAGPIEAEERSRLEALAAAAGARLTILGAVDDVELEQRLAEADIIACLRRPVLEGASASAIEGMLSGRPTIVANAGFYAELPDEMVIKVSPEVSPSELAERLEELVHDEPVRRKVGDEAVRWARRTFSLELYVDVLEEVITATAAALPMLRTTQQLGELLGRMNLREQDPSLPRLLGHWANLTGRDPLEA